MKHVVMYSGGAGSWHAAKRLAAKHGTENLFLMFTDTTMEDDDLYRFLVEGAYNIYGKAAPDFQVPKMPEIPDDWIDYVQIGQRYLDYLENRRQTLHAIAEVVREDLPNFIWITSDDDPWTIFFKENMMGSSRIDLCSRILKREPARDFIGENFSVDDTVIYLGHGWDEEHRVIKAKRNWDPYRLEAPNTEEPLIDPDDVRSSMEAEGIRQPNLYKEGFPHNNCGGFCVRAGHAHFKHLWATRPTMYRYMEALEQWFITKKGKNVSILKDRRGGVAKPMTLLQLRARIEGNDLTNEEACDWGGCGCFSDVPA